MNKCTSDWPRFLVIQDEVKDSKLLMKLSPFAIAKGITGLAAEPVSVKKTSFGLLVEVSKKSHAENLLKSKVLANVPIKVTVHRTLNSSRGVIRCRELSGMTEEEISDELSAQSVSVVKRIMLQKGQKATDTYILTFQKAELPPAIKVGYLNIKVKPYIPNPLRCYKCQDYGHGANKCTHQERCSRCGQEHANQNCKEEPFCVHCHQNHEASDRTCSRYLMERKIQQVKFTEKISFPEARKRVESETARPLYSAAVAKKTNSVAIQTSVTWPKDSPSPGIYSEDMDPFFPQNQKVTTAQALSTTQPMPEFSQGLIEGIKAGITSDPALRHFIQTLFETIHFKMNLHDKAEASTSTTVETNTEHHAPDRTNIQRNLNTEKKSSSLILNKSTGDLPGATSSEVGPTPPSSKYKSTTSKFPLNPNPKSNNSKDRSIKSAPRTKVTGPNK